jgi:hypothetical protein
MQGQLTTAEYWAALLGTRVLRPDEFDGIAVSRDTPGWASIEATQLRLSDSEQINTWLTELKAKRQVIAGVLAADERHRVRIVLRQQAPQPQRSKAPRRKERQQ